MPFQDLQNIFQFSITVGEVLKNLLIALVGGYLISLVYRWTYNGPGYSNKFIHSLIIITMITSIVILVIGNNLARAFGLVGAMSIIRFRTAVKDTHDIVFIFFALATGLAAGVGLHQVTLVGVLFIGLVQIILYSIDFGGKRKQEYLLQLSFIPQEHQEPEYLNIFKTYCRSSKLINVRSLGRDDLLELSFYVILRNRSHVNDLVKELRGLPEVGTVNLYYDEGVK